MTDHMEAIRNCALFEGIGENDIRHILTCLKARVMELKKNDYAAVSEGRYEGVGIVLKGEAAIVKESLDGNRTRVNIFRAGDMFGEVVAICKSDRWPASVQALTDCTILYVHPEKYWISAITSAPTTGSSWQISSASCPKRRIS